MSRVDRQADSWWARLPYKKVQNTTKRKKQLKTCNIREYRNRPKRVEIANEIINAIVQNNHGNVKKKISLFYRSSSFSSVCKWPTARYRKLALVSRLIIIAMEQSASGLKLLVLCVFLGELIAASITCPKWYLSFTQVQTTPQRGIPITPWNAAGLSMWAVLRRKWRIMQPKRSRCIDKATI